MGGSGHGAGDSWSDGQYINTRRHLRTSLCSASRTHRCTSRSNIRHSLHVTMGVRLRKRPDPESGWSAVAADRGFWCSSRSGEGAHFTWRLIQPAVNDQRVCIMCSRPFRFTTRSRSGLHIKRSLQSSVIAADLKNCKYFTHGYASMSHPTKSWSWMLWVIPSGVSVRFRGPVFLSFAVMVFPLPPLCHISFETVLILIVHSCPSWSMFTAYQSVTKEMKDLIVCLFCLFLCFIINIY